MATDFYTHSTVPTEEPPPFDAESALEVVDVTGTFIDTPENSGAEMELPVAGAFASLPNIVDIVKIAAEKRVHTIADRDTHIAGKNPTVISSYAGLAPNTWLTYADVETWRGKDNDPILPSAGFTVDNLLGWLDVIPAHAYMAWNGHANPLTKLYHIYPTVFRALVENPSFELCNKGSEPSLISTIIGLMVESYSAIRLSTGESLGRAENLRARGKKKVFTVGIASDFCEGNTDLDLADEGFEVWSVVDAGASVNIPNFGGSGMTSDQMMVQQKTKAGVHFCTTAAIKRVNGYKA